MKSRLNWHDVYFRQAKIQLGEKFKIIMPGIVLIIISIIAIIGFILYSSTWTCGNFSKEIKKEVKAELKNEK